MRKLFSLLSVIAVMGLLMCVISCASFSAAGNNENVDSEQVVEPTATQSEIVASGTCGDDARWTIDSNGTMIVSGTGAIKDYVSAPRWRSMGIKHLIVEEGITFIGQSAFSQCVELETVELSSTVESLNICAFSGCENMKSINLGGSLEIIGMSVFSGCSSLTTIAGLDSVKAVFSNAFGNCTSLEEIAFSDGMLSDGISAAFSGCSSLKKVVIGEGVKRISDGTFENCYNLTTVYLGESVTSIGKDAFKYCSSLAEVYYAGNESSLSYDFGANVKVYYHCDFLPHEWELVETYTEANCSNEGSGKYRCKYCYITKEDVIPVDPEAHIYGETGTVVTEPACAEDGVESFVCVLCGHEDLRPIPAKGHSSDYVFLYDENSHWAACPDCDTPIAFDEHGVPMESYNSDPHIFGEVIIVDEKPVYICEVCGYQKDAEYDPRVFCGASIKGDANNDGAVNMKDVLAMRKYLAELTTDIYSGADIDEDSLVNMKDVLILRKYLAEIIDTLDT